MTRVVLVWIWRAVRFRCVRDAVVLGARGYSLGVAGYHGASHKIWTLI